MTAHAGFESYAPSVLIRPYNPEQKKYAKVWEHARYREVSPGEQWAQLFLDQAKPPRDADAIDFGCGTGRGALMLALFGAMRVKMLDFAPNCLDPEVAQACETQADRLSFEVADLTQPIGPSAAYGYCCDVMEHIPPDDVRKVLRNVLSSAQHVFFGISTVPDNLGSLIGETLHLTVQPMTWWVEQIQSLGATVHWTADLDGEACAIYCSAWADAGELVKTGKVNIGDDTINAQVRENLLAGWNQARPHDTQDREVVVLAGGPSMTGQLEKIRELRAAGAAVVTLNGAYHWAVENGLGDAIGAQVVLDGREFNARFVDPVLPQCRYLIASQAHPKTLGGLPRDHTLLWHSGVSDENEELARSLNGGLFFPVPGGSTVTLRAIPLLRMLGFKRLHLFGFDSCVTDGGKHHAYAQTENDHEPVIPVTCGGRTFLCTPWMTSQASEFRDLVKFLGDEVELAVYGDGLIAHIIATGASFSVKD